MANQDDIYKFAAENARMYEEWLKCANEVAAAIPVVKKSMQWDLLCAQTIKAAPTGYYLPNSESLLNQLSIENNYLKTNKPSLPQVTSFMQTGSAVSYNVGTEAASLLSGVAQQSTDEVKVWATQQLEYFVKPLQEDPFIATISSKLDRLYLGLTKEFQEAMQATRSVIAGNGINSSAGIAMRNVLENLKGNMLQVARQRSGNKNISKWEEAAKIVAKGGAASFESNQLVSKEVDWKKLWDETTPLAKNNSKMTAPDLEAAYFRWLGLLHSTLRFIELNDGT